MGGALDVTAGPDSVVFFSKTEVEKMVVKKFDLVLHSRFKTKRSPRSDVDSQIDRMGRSADCRSTDR